MGTKLKQPNDHSPLFSVETTLKFPSGNEREGFLVYDADKRVFITALTDLWEFPVDWNDPKCDMAMVDRIFNYRWELDQTITTLLSQGLMKYSVVKN